MKTKTNQGIGAFKLIVIIAILAIIGVMIMNKSEEAEVNTEEVVTEEVVTEETEATTEEATNVEVEATVETEA